MNVMPGDHIVSAINKALETGGPCQFVFNEVIVRTDPSICSDVDIICRDYFRAVGGYIPKEMGPEYASEIPEIEKFFEGKIKEIELRHSKDLHKWESKIGKILDVVLDKPAFAHTEIYQKHKLESDDPYYQRILKAAEHCGALIERGMSFEEALKIADYDGLTGYMVSAVVAILHSFGVNT